MKILPQTAVGYTAMTGRQYKSPCGNGGTEGCCSTLAEVVGRSVILTYKDVAIILSQAAIKGLHKEFVTHM